MAGAWVVAIVGAAVTCLVAGLVGFCVWVKAWTATSVELVMEGASLSDEEVEDYLYKVSERRS